MPRKSLFALWTAVLDGTIMEQALTSSGHEASGITLTKACSRMRQTIPLTEQTKGIIMAKWTPEVVEKQVQVVKRPVIGNRPPDGTLIKATLKTPYFEQVVYGTLQPDYGETDALMLDIVGTYTSLYVEVEKWDLEILAFPGDETSSD